MVEMPWKVLFLLLGASSCLGGGVAGEAPLQVVRFMAEGVTTTTSYLDADSSELPDFEEVTLCLHFRLWQFSQLTPFLSYYANGSDNELTIGIRGNTMQFQLYCCGNAASFRVELSSLEPFKWHHLCVALSLEMRSLVIVINDQIINGTLNEKTGRSLVINGRGRLVVGQELDTEKGYFNLVQSLAGEVADWTLLNESLSLKEMKEYVACRGLPGRVRPVLHLDSSLSGWELKGPSLSYNLTVDDVCRRRMLDSLVVFPQRLEKEESVRFCEMLGGTLPLPQNQEDNNDLVHLLKKYEQECMNNWNTVAWLGIFGNLTAEVWQSQSDFSPLTWTNFHEHSSHPSQMCGCVSMDVLTISGQWGCVSCEAETCPVCHFSNTPLLYLRGLCEDSDFDDTFMLKSDPGKTPLYVGKFKSLISLMKETWRLESTLNESRSFAVMLDDVSTSPIGRHNWSIDSDECGELEKELLLSACSSEQFPCDNGQCVAQDRRCDQVSDCYDESDEQNCLVISVPDEYQKRVTPPPTSEGALTLLFSLEITSVRNFDLVGFKIGLDMILRVEWKDIRLDFFNLRNRIFSNRVRTYDRIWIPKFYVESDSGSPAEKLQTSPPTLLVRRDHPPRPDDTSRVTKEQVFDGAHNSLVLHKPISITLNCQFYLRTYPFDDQQCSFVYFLYNGNNVSFILNSVMFTGHPQLLEYEVVGTSGVVNNSAVSSFSVVIKFTNQFGYYVGNAFLPSIFLVIICYLTFWFSLDDFQDRIMVSLTSLLVLTGLMTQTSQSIPKTAYLKLIDVWYIALIFMDFMIIVVLAVIENLRQYSSSREVKVMRIHNKHEQKAPFVWLPQPGLGVERKVNVISIVVFPLACIIFIIIYFAISLSYIAN
ncbi:uncharacterized protein LOC135100807 isoform X2 [Scylla paramamosain]|uniref:uncharacterized protein LOC135100807 isoform X2 n=1 Tax=Scylla paramamosain TaxID=85552 RepID=UPI0030833B23